jgi:serine/threonine protein kinase
VSAPLPAVSERYRIERELGRGGMATVYLAEDLKHGRRVAVKVMDPEISRAIGRERLAGGPRLVLADPLAPPRGPRASRRRARRDTRGAAAAGPRACPMASLLTWQGPGATEAERERLGVDPHMRFWDALLERFLGGARRAVGVEAANRAGKEGRALSFEDGMSLALNATRGPLR